MFLFMSGIKQAGDRRGKIKQDMAEEQQPLGKVV